MRNSLRLLSALALVVMAASAVRAFTIDPKPRVLNDVPTSTLTFGVGPDFADILDQGVSAPTGFANRHDACIADGATGEVFNNSDFWSLSADVKLTDLASPTAPSTRKEAGLRINNSVGGDFLFIVNTDAHEVVSFGGPGPFYNFRDHGVPNFVSGDTVNMSICYGQDPYGNLFNDPNNPANPNNGKIQNGVVLSVNGVYSPFLPMTNIENGVLANSNVCMYTQIVNSPNDPTNGGHAVFSNVRFTRTDGTCVPEPGSLALLAGGLLPLLGLRRRK